MGSKSFRFKGYQEVRGEEEDRGLKEWHKELRL